MQGTFDYKMMITPPEEYSALCQIDLSMRKQVVYNPSLLDVWFDIDGVIYKIASGETLKIKDIT